MTEHTTSPATSEPSRYTITCAVSSPSNPGRAVGAWVTRIGSRVRPGALCDMGTVSTHEAMLRTIAAALREPRARRLPITVYCNQQAVIQAAVRALPELTAHVPPGDASAESAVAAAVAATGVNVRFEFLGNGSGDIDLTAAREAAQHLVAARRDS